MNLDLNNLNEDEYIRKLRYHGLLDDNSCLVKRTTSKKKIHLAGEASNSKLLNNDKSTKNNRWSKDNIN